MTPSTPLRLRRLVERQALALDVGREADPRVVLEHAPEQPLAILERDVEERPTVEVEQVEGLVHEPRGGLVAELGLEQREVGAALVVERDDLAIDDGLAGVDPGRRRSGAAGSRSRRR